MKQKKTKKQSQVILAALAKKSKDGLEYARRTILSEKIYHRKLRMALEYYVSRWNDVTHPGLFAVAYEAVGGDLRKAVPFQAAVALMAAAFDIHDDILDKSALKHGEQTVFGKFGEEMSLLLGNAFMIEGFTLFAESLEETDQARPIVLGGLKRALYEFGNAHALELNLKKRIDVRPERYVRIVKMKAASVEGDMRIGAVVGGGTSQEVEALARFGRILGTLSMLREEFVDVFDVEELNQRMSNEYLPIPILYAMQDSKSKKKIWKLLSRRVSGKNVDVLVDLVFETKQVKDLKEHMERLVAEAINLTSKVRKGKSKDQLRSFVSSTLEDI